MKRSLKNGGVFDEDADLVLHSQSLPDGLNLRWFHVRKSELISWFLSPNWNFLQVLTDLFFVLAFRLCSLKVRRRKHSKRWLLFDERDLPDSPFLRLKWRLEGPDE